METPEISNAKNELFKYTTEGNLTEVKRLINDLKLPVNCYDVKGMTPLQHAAFKGHYEICKLLLDCGADVNENKDLYGYNPLSLAAISNHCDVVRLLLEYGADPAVINANKRTATEMAAFTGNHKPASIIKNYILKDAIDDFTEIYGAELKPKLPYFLSSPVHKLVNLLTIHPVRITLHLQSNKLILQNLKKIINVLNIMAEKQLKEEANDRLSLKMHHYSFVLSSVSDFITFQASDPEEEIYDPKMLNGFIKSLLKGSLLKDGSISLNLEKFLRKSVSAYPFSSCLLYQQLVTTLSATELGEIPNTDALLNNAILCQHPPESELCATCGDHDSVKKCLGCEKVHYCNKTCQKLHWFVHKSDCKK